MGYNQNTLISVVAVVQNDADIIRSFVTDTSVVLSSNYRYYELLLVDNGSTDGSNELVRQIQKELPNIRMMRLSRAYNAEIALASALENSIGDYVVILDVTCDPPSLIPSMVEEAISGYDVIIAERTHRGEESILEVQFKVLYYKIAGRILGYALHPNASYFRVFSRRVVNSINLIKNKSRYLKYFIAWAGYKQKYFPYERFYRRSGRHGAGFLKDTQTALDVILSNSALPLRLASLVGVIGSFLNLLYIGYIFVVTLVKQKIAEGWLTTNLVSTSMFFLLFLILTILSEYVARILDETKEMPLYFIEYESHSYILSYKGERESEGQLNVV